MTTFGKNMRITVDQAERSKTRRLFGEVFGAKVLSPRPDLEVYVFDDGFSLGAYFVPAQEALSAGDRRKAPWLELCVDDPAAAHQALEALEIRPFEYWDRDHRYYDPPCGPVFRLAPRAPK